MPTLALALGAAAGAAWLHHRAGALTPTACPCDRADLPAWDRWAAAAPRPEAERAADLTLAASLATSALVASLAAPEDRALDTVLAASEAAAVAALLTQIAKVSLGRPYPYLYGPADRPGPRYPTQLGDGVNYGSAWSGHTAVPLAAAVVVAARVSRGRRGVGAWLPWVVGPGLALAAGALQVRAANHFPSDVAAGALVGLVVGLAWDRLAP